MSAHSITAPLAVPERIKIVLRMLMDAADRGAPCPTNDEICGKIGAESSATAANCVALLEGAGLITVERRQKQRRVTILETGKSTAPLTGVDKPHMPCPRSKYREVHI